MDNVFALFLAAAERLPERPAVEVFRPTGLDTYTYREVRGLADRTARLLARWLRGRHARARSSPTTTPAGAARISASCGSARSRCRSTPRTRPDRSGRSSPTPARACSFTTAAYLATAQEAVAGLTPAPQIVMMAGTAPGLASLDESGDAVAPPPACPATALGPGRHPLHLRHDERSEGRRADARQPARRARRRAPDRRRSPRTTASSASCRSSTRWRRSPTCCCRSRPAPASCSSRR